MTDTDLDILAAKIADKLSIQPRWLKLAIAAKYAGMNPKRLKGLAVSGDIIGYRDPDTNRNDWIFDKKSIDKYRLRPVHELSVKSQKILDDIERFI